ncbi:MAG: T9SS type A sorting domain-containing protein [Prevotellaceae bacterium]|jgi:hypothetical protein|nr:T9SS type A sorting domain-containing protein [Prevotellaceae bacterium]
MKKITLLSSFVICCAVFAQAQLIISDDFNYTVDAELKANGWVGTGSGTPSTTNPILVTAASITYLGYPGSGIGNEISLTTSGEDLNKSFDAITSGSIYFSALVNLSAAQATGDYFLHIADAPTGSTFFGRTFAKLANDKVAFGIQNTSGGTPAPTPTYTDAIYELNTTYLLVVKVNVSTSESSLIVNPAIGSAEPESGWISNSSGTGAIPAAGFKTINVRQGTAANAPALKLDGLRVAASWSDLFTTAGTSNPSADKISFRVSGNTLVAVNLMAGTSVEIYNAVGSRVQTSVFDGNPVELNNLSKGIYIVRAGKHTQKVAF